MSASTIHTHDLIAAQFSNERNKSLPSRTAIIGALLSELPVRNHVDAPLVDDCDAPEGLCDLRDGHGVGVDRGGHVAPLQNGVDKTGELHGIGSEDGLFVPPNHVWVVGQVPEAVGVDDDGDVAGLALVDHNRDAAQHGLVSTEAGTC